jgi:hypothetical protein
MKHSYLDLVALAELFVRIGLPIIIIFPAFFVPINKFGHPLAHF